MPERSVSPPSPIRPGMLSRRFAADVPCLGHRRQRLWGRLRAAPLHRAAAARLRAGGDQPAAAGLQAGRGLARGRAGRGWQRLSAGDGPKGPRLYDWAYLPYARRWPPRLAERPADPSLARRSGRADLLFDAGAEASACLNLVGWRACAGRSRPALKRPKARSAWTNTRCALGRLASPHHAGDAGACLSCRRPRAAGGGKDRGRPRADLLPLTVPELRRLLWHLVWAAHLIPGPRSVVTLAPPPPAASPQKPLETTNFSSNPAVVLRGGFHNY